MIVRELIGDNDIAGMVPGIIHWARTSERQDLFPDSDAGLIRAFIRFLQLPGMEVLIAEHEGKVVGFFGAVFIPWMWNLEKLMAEQAFWWAAPDAPRGTAHALFEQMLLLCQERKAVPILKAPTDGSPGLARLFKRRGLRETETAYIGM